MIDNIIWDFDGVILNSMSIREWGFEEIFKEYPRDKVEKLLEFHSNNGGLSRYVKIRYFFKEILNRSITTNSLQELAESFSVLMKKELINKDHLIVDTINFIKLNYTKYNFHIASGSDQEELRFLCEKLGIAHFFKSIHGSPTPKSELVRKIIETKQYDLKRTCIIGDSINDYEAAKKNRILFFGYNNPLLKNYPYIHSFSDPKCVQFDL